MQKRSGWVPLVVAGGALVAFGGGCGGADEEAISRYIGDWYTDSAALRSCNGTGTTSFQLSIARANGDADLEVPDPECPLRWRVIDGTARLKAEQACNVALEEGSTQLVFTRGNMKSSPDANSLSFSIGAQSYTGDVACDVALDGVFDRIGGGVITGSLTQKRPGARMTARGTRTP